MELSDFIIIILLISCIAIWFINLFSKCPTQPLLQPQIVYKYRPELDLQFDERNMPSKIYDYVFNGENVYQGGYQNLSVLSKSKK
jgi:hypothetical protein